MPSWCWRRAADFSIRRLTGLTVEQIVGFARLYGRSKASYIRAHHGFSRTRNGAVYMPPFEGILNQEATWAIKAYLETRREKPL